MNHDRRNFFAKLALGLSVSALTKNIFITGEDQLINKMQDINWGEIRELFPLTRDRIYLNNGTFGPSPFPVIERLNKEISDINTSGEYGHTNETIKKVAQFIQAEESEIALTHNTTEGINIMAFGIKMNAGDEIIMTSHEHVGNALPWLNRAKRDNLVIKAFNPGVTNQENLDLIRALVTKRTKVIAIPHVTCTSGTVFPIKEIADFARTQNIISAIDGAHGLGSFNIEIQALGVDMYATCGHKWLLGPAGTGALYISKNILPEIEAVHVGAYSDSGWKLDEKQQMIAGFNPSAHRFFYGTQGKAHFSGIDAAIDFHDVIGKDKIEGRIRYLNNYLFEGLQQFQDRIKILTPEEKESRLPMVSFQPINLDYKQLGKALGDANLRVRQVPESGLDAIRISTHIYNSKEEIDYLLQVLESKL